MSTVNLPRRAVTIVGSSKLLPKFIGPFRSLHRQGTAYMNELPRGIRTHPLFRLSVLRRSYLYTDSSDNGDSRNDQESPSYS